MDKQMTVSEFFILMLKVIALLQKNWKIIFLYTILGASIMIIKNIYTRPLYSATFSFALEDEKAAGAGGLSSAIGLASQLGVDLGGNAGGAFSGTNLIVFMQSRNIVEKALLNPINVSGKCISLAEYYLNFMGMMKGWKENKEMNNFKLPYVSISSHRNFSRLQDSILGVLYEKITNDNLKVTQRDKKISIISIDLKSEDELFSKVFAETIAREVSTFYIETKTKKSASNVNILQKQVDSIQTELNSAITGVASANDHIFNLNAALNIKRVPSSRRQIDVQANTAILTELVKNLELAKISLRRETPLIQVIDTPIYPLKKIKERKLKSFILGSLAGFFISVIQIIGFQYYKKLRIIVNKL